MSLNNCEVTSSAGFPPTKHSQGARPCWLWFSAWQQLVQSSLTDCLPTTVYSRYFGRFGPFAQSFQLHFSYHRAFTCDSEGSVITLKVSVDNNEYYRIYSSLTVKAPWFCWILHCSWEDANGIACLLAWLPGWRNEGNGLQKQNPSQTISAFTLSGKKTKWASKSLLLDIAMDLVRTRHITCNVSSPLRIFPVQARQHLTLPWAVCSDCSLSSPLELAVKMKFPAGPEGPEELLAGGMKELTRQYTLTSQAY